MILNVVSEYIGRRRVRFVERWLMREWRMGAELVQMNRVGM